MGSALTAIAIPGARLTLRSRPRHSAYLVAITLSGRCADRRSPRWCDPADWQSCGRSRAMRAPCRGGAAGQAPRPQPRRRSDGAGDRLAGGRGPAGQELQRRSSAPRLACGAPDRVVERPMRMPRQLRARGGAPANTLERLGWRRSSPCPGVERSRSPSTTPVRFAPQRPVEIEGPAATARVRAAMVSVVRAGAGYFAVLGHAADCRARLLGRRQIDRRVAGGGREPELRRQILAGAGARSAVGFAT